VFETKLVPVRIFVRHKKWQELRNFVISYLQNDDAAGLLYQPILHPDFLGIPIKPDNKCQETYDAIKSHLTKKNGIMLDIGANMGFFCHKFEDLGYQCYAIENDPNTFKILKRIRDAENKRFVVSRESIFETDVAKKIHFDLVLALNILHHFLKTKKLFYNLKKLLKVLDTDKMFFSAAHFREEQMRNAYQNYSEPRFVEFILKHTTLSKSEKILVGRGGRQVYKLSK
jgi:2-polyprenyl-3-methyl-5-hydroxy-6-metoxy-1,4-benzoquinol methylase